MTETSYTAWDDKLYQWPPPDGWYEAGDGKWWPEGYGPGPTGSPENTSGSAGSMADGDGTGADVASGAGLGADGATFDPGAAGLGPFGNGEGAAASTDAGAAAETASSAASDALSRLTGSAGGVSESLSGGVDAAADSLADQATDAASAVPSSLSGLTDRATDAASGFADRATDSASGLTDGATDAVSGLTDRAAGSGSGSGLTDRAADAASGLTDRAADAAGDAVPGDNSPRGQTASDVLARLTGRSTGARSGSGAAAAAGAAAAGAAESAAEAMPDLGSDRLPEGLSGAVPESLTDAGSSFGAATDAVGDLAPDLTPDRASGGLTDAVPDALSGSAGSAADAIGDVVPDGLGEAGRSALGNLDGVKPADAIPSLDDLPERDDVGAALAETLGSRSEALSDPASSGISGLADLANPGADPAAGSAADAAAEASQFLTADIPASDLAKATERPPTDLDALPPPPFDPPGFTAPAADALGDLADRAPDLAPGADGPDPAPTLFPGAGPGPAADVGEAASGRSIAGFEFPPGETLPPPSGPEAVGGPAAASLGLPLSTSGGGGGGAPTDPASGFGRPDETIVAPLAGAGDLGTNPAETGQFPAGSAEPADWGVPAADAFNAPPPPAEGPGAMPWGQAGAPGGPPVAGGLDPAVLQDNRSGSGRTLMMVGAGVLFLVLLGVAAYLIFGGGSGDGAGDATGPGSFAEPHARSTPVEVFYPLGDGEQRFVIQVLEPLRDASGQAAAEAPAEGERFAVTRVRVANQSPTDASVSDLRFNAITASGTVIDRAGNSCAITEPALDFAAVLGEAGVAEGVVCWVVPAADYDGLLLGIESTQVSGRIHINLQ